MTILHIYDNHLSPQFRVKVLICKLIYGCREQVSKEHKLQHLQEHTRGFLLGLESNQYIMWQRTDIRILSMLFHQLFDPVSCTFTYLIASGLGREALLIDPVLEQLPLYMQLLNELQVQLTFTIETHTHADHITASGTLREKLQSQIIMGVETDAQPIDLTVNDGDNIILDHLKLTAIHTPGHTQDSYSFVLDNRVFTGDTLLINSTGRTDFQQGDALAQYDSLFNKLLKLPDQTLVYPAHDYHGRTVSSIIDEKMHNPRLQVQSSTEYAEIMSKLNLAPPKMLDIAVAANLKCGVTTCKLS